MLALSNIAMAEQTAAANVAELSTELSGNTVSNTSDDQDKAMRHFADGTQRQRYYQLIEQLRCPKCQNQNLADSDAPIANDLRNELHLLITEGYDDKAILAFMVSRYGDFVLYAPPVNNATAVLWLLPAALALFGLTVVVVIIARNRRASSAAASSSGLDTKTRQRIDKIVAAQNTQNGKDN